MFEVLWKGVEGLHSGHPMVQRKEEARTVFHLIKGLDASSYLEIGSALGGSLWLYAHALRNRSRVVSIDLEAVPRLRETIESLSHLGFNATLTQGDSRTVPVPDERFDVVFIDGAHRLDMVQSDYERFAPLADKLVLLHDIEAPGPKCLMMDLGARIEIRQPEAPGLMGYGLIWK